MRIIRESVKCLKRLDCSSKLRTFLILPHMLWIVCFDVVVVVGGGGGVVVDVVFDVVDVVDVVVGVVVDVVDVVFDVVVCMLRCCF